MVETNQYGSNAVIKDGKVYIPRYEKGRTVNISPSGGVVVTYSNAPTPPPIQTDTTIKDSEIEERYKKSILEKQKETEENLAKEKKRKEDIEARKRLQEELDKRYPEPTAGFPTEPTIPFDIRRAESYNVDKTKEYIQRRPLNENVGIRVENGKWFYAEYKKESVPVKSVKEKMEEKYPRYYTPTELFFKQSFEKGKDIYGKTYNLIEGIDRKKTVINYKVSDLPYIKYASPYIDKYINSYFNISKKYVSSRINENILLRTAIKKTPDRFKDIYKTEVKYTAKVLYPFETPTEAVLFYTFAPYYKTRPEVLKEAIESGAYKPVTETKFVALLERKGSTAKLRVLSESRTGGLSTFSFSRQKIKSVNKTYNYGIGNVLTETTLKNKPSEYRVYDVLSISKKYKGTPNIKQIKGVMYKKVNLDTAVKTFGYSKEYLKSNAPIIKSRSYGVTKGSKIKNINYYLGTTEDPYLVLTTKDLRQKFRSPDIGGYIVVKDIPKRNNIRSFKIKGSTGNKKLSITESKTISSQVNIQSGIVQTQKLNKIDLIEINKPKIKPISLKAITREKTEVTYLTQQRELSGLKQISISKTTPKKINKDLTINIDKNILKSDLKEESQFRQRQLVRPKEITKGKQITREKLKFKLIYTNTYKPKIDLSLRSKIPIDTGIKSRSAIQTTIPKKKYKVKTGLYYVPSYSQLSFGKTRTISRTKLKTFSSRLTGLETRYKYKIK